MRNGVGGALQQPLHRHLARSWGFRMLPLKPGDGKEVPGVEFQCRSRSWSNSSWWIKDEKGRKRPGEGKCWEETWEKMATGFFNRLRYSRVAFSARSESCAKGAEETSDE